MSAGVGEITAVAELQGLEGAFSFAERLLQRIWLNGDFDPSRAITADGRKVSVLHPGRWNRLGGPDFFGARLEIGGVSVNGDVELHLRASDWRTHGHRDDPKYCRVVLHVVLFPPQSATIGADGREIPVLALLPLLYRSLEEYADEEAVERLANHPLTVAHEALLALSREEQNALLLECARERWKQKVGFAALRIQRLGWREACHQTALEILGYRFNRGPMLLLATERPLDAWPACVRDEAFETLLAEFSPRWNRQAVRPANHPKTRLRQYGNWTTRVPNWPEALLNVGHSLAVASSSDVASTTEFRKQRQLPDLIERIASDVCANAISGPRFLTLIADGFWPLLAAHSGGKAEDSPYWPYWFHGYCGDVPDRIRKILSALEITGARNSPLSHGLAQGLLGWVWREEERAQQPVQQTTACSCGRGT